MKWYILLMKWYILLMKWYYIEKYKSLMGLANNWWCIWTEILRSVCSIVSDGLGSGGLRKYNFGHSPGCERMEYNLASASKSEYNRPCINLHIRAASIYAVLLGPFPFLYPFVQLKDNDIDDGPSTNQVLFKCKKLCNTCIST